MRQETSSPKDRKTWKILAWLFIGSISIVSIAGYTLLTITINASSPKQILMGDAFVVQPTSESKADQVLLTAVAYSPDSISYYIEACGSHPYNGFLVLVDNAQITNMELEGEDIGTPIPKLQKLSSYPDAGNGYRVVHDILNIYPIVHSTGELISFKIPKVLSLHKEKHKG